MLALAVLSKLDDWVVDESWYGLVLVDVDEEGGDIRSWLVNWFAGFVPLLWILLRMFDC